MASSEPNTAPVKTDAPSPHRVNDWPALAAYHASWALLWVLAAAVTRRRVLGLEHVPRTGPFLFAANHISHFDPWMLGLALPRVVDWMATAEFFSPAPLGAWMRAVGTFPVNRGGVDARAVRETARRLRAGHVVGLFPEGGIRAGETSVLEGAPLRLGLGRLAQLGSAPVLPCVIVGADRLYDRRRWRPLWRRVPVWIGFGPPIRPEKWAGESTDLLGERLRALYARVRAEFHLEAADLPTTPQRRKGHF